ncbi:hypothetical protein [Actinacidiphila yanglinensis]|nr:hypothetical protein [Actinacidiphila yanglinensis]
MVEALAWWGALFATQVMLIGRVDAVELAVAGAAATVGALAACRIRRAVPAAPGTPRARRPRAATLRGVLALPWSLVRGSGVLARDVLHGGGCAAGTRVATLQEGTRTASVALLLAASPDSCVLAITEGPDGEDRVEVHALRRRPSAVERAITGRGRTR